MTKKRCTLVVLCVAALAAALAVLGTRPRRPRHERVVEFTYSWVQPCNTNFYTYGYSIGPIRDLFLCWSGDGRVSQSDFAKDVKARFRGFPDIVALRLSDEDVGRLCRGVEFSLVTDGERFAHPIPCRMTVRGDSEAVVEALARAFREAMLHDNEVESRIRACRHSKAALDKGRILVKCEEELGYLRYQLAASRLGTNETARLKAAVSTAESAVCKARAEWEAEIAVSRLEWGSSLVFRDDSP